jgi:hypothetical protein
MKRFTFPIICCCILSCVILSSCASNKYSDTLSCTDITKSLQSKILADDDYREYSADEVRYIFNGRDSFDSCSIIYSAASDDIGEIGVFHAASEEEAKKLLNDTEEHVQKEREEKSEFLRNYLPNESKKLENAEVKRFGNYVVYAVNEDKDAVFSYIEKLLKK